MRICDLRHDEVLLTSDLVDAISDAIVAYADELELTEDDPDYNILVDFSNDVAQMVLRTLKERKL